MAFPPAVRVQARVLVLVPPPAPPRAPALPAIRPLPWAPLRERALLDRLV